MLVKGIFASYSCREYLGICAFVRTTYKYVVIRIVVFYVIIKIVLEIRDIILGNMRIGVNIGIIFFLTNIENFRQSMLLFRQHMDMTV